jgi:hypothetical protein
VGVVEISFFVLIDLERPESWPVELRSYLDRNYKLFLDWEGAGSTSVSPSAYDRAVYGLQDILQLYQIRGWHCTRLTDEEVVSIIEGGMCLPDAAMLARRIERLVQQGLLTRQIAERLKAENQAHETNRAGMVWFLLFCPTHRRREWNRALFSALGRRGSL